MKHGTKGRLALGAVTAALLAGCGAGGGGGTGGGGGHAGGGSASPAAAGTFTVTLAAPALPCLVQARKDGLTLHGFATLGGRVNVTPLTELLIARAIGGGPAQAFANSPAPPPPTRHSLSRTPTRRPPRPCRPDSMSPATMCTTRRPRWRVDSSPAIR